MRLDERPVEVCRPEPGLLLPVSFGRSLIVALVKVQLQAELGSRIKIVPEPPDEEPESTRVGVGNFYMVARLGTLGPIKDEPRDPEGICGQVRELDQGPFPNPRDSALLLRFVSRGMPSWAPVRSRIAVHCSGVNATSRHQVARVDFFTGTRSMISP